MKNGESSIILNGKGEKMPANCCDVEDMMAWKKLPGCHMAEEGFRASGIHLYNLLSRSVKDILVIRYLPLVKFSLLRDLFFLFWFSLLCKFSSGDRQPGVLLIVSHQPKHHGEFQVVYGICN